MSHRVTITAATAELLRNLATDAGAINPAPEIAEALAELTMAMDTDLAALGESVAWDPFREGVRAVDLIDSKRSATETGYADRSQALTNCTRIQFAGVGLDLADGPTARAALRAFSIVRHAAAHHTGANRSAVEPLVSAVTTPLSIAVVRHLPSEVRA